MTLEEAREAAERRVPVYMDGIEYERITEVGHIYDTEGNKKPYVVMRSNKNSITRAEPRKVSFKKSEEDDKAFIAGLKKIVAEG